MTAFGRQAFTGSDADVPSSIRLYAGSITCEYEKGALRYLSIGQEEIIRKLYATIRDAHWLTLAVTIYNEKITRGPDFFYIKYDCTYLAGEIHYNASVTISGGPDHQISYLFDGKACSNFFKNRIGICAHLPIDSCSGADALVEHSAGGSETITFPDHIHPYQPAFDIRSLSWITPGQHNVLVQLDGDLFEMEDHRNWSDASFKIYSTPLSEPFPVMVKIGDQLYQSVVIKVKDLVVPDNKPQVPILVTISHTTSDFPRIGYSQPAINTVLTKKQTDLLTAIPFDHYRVSLQMKSNWQARYFDALEVCEKTSAKLELIVFFSVHYKKESNDLITVLAQSRENIYSLLLLYEGTPFTPAWLTEQVMPLLSSHLQGVRLGIGTDDHFADWNRNFVTGHQADFTAYPINPQMHADDYATIIENLAGQAETIRTANHRSGNLPLFISPLTLKLRYTLQTADRYSAWDIDERHGSLFTAAWTCLSLKYLVHAQQITLFEMIGAGGIMPASCDDSTSTVFPVYLVMQELFAFKPVSVADTQTNRPLEADAVTFINSKKEWLCILINFTGTKQEVTFDIALQDRERCCYKTLTAKNMIPFLNDPSSFLSMDNQPSKNMDHSKAILPAYSISFLKCLTITHQ